MVPAGEIDLQETRGRSAEDHRPCVGSGNFENVQCQGKPGSQLKAYGSCNDDTLLTARG